MKKLIVSALFFTAFISSTFANETADKASSNVPKVVEVILLSEEDVECTSTIIPICSGGSQVGGIPATVCADNLLDFLSSLEC